MQCLLLVVMINDGDDCFLFLMLIAHYYVMDVPVAQMGILVCGYALESECVGECVCVCVYIQMKMLVSGRC